MRTIFFTILIFSFTHCNGQTESVTLLNSPLDEQSPVLSPDGNTLYFTISNHPLNVAGRKDLGDIWYAQRSASGWSAPTHGGAMINNPLHNTVAGVSPDGNQLFLMGHYIQNGRSVNSQGLAVSVWTGDSWASPQNIVIPYFKNKTPFQSGHLSPDGNVLVFSADTYSTLGAEDIYVSLKSNGKWSEPRNIGPSINTTFQDVSPSLGPDGKRLFFASNGRQGYGSFDIFYADRLDDTWLHWSAPVNLGLEINSEGRELFYRSFLPGDFYTTTNNSDGYGDLRFRPAMTEQEIQDSVQVDISTNMIASKDTASRIKEIVYETPREKEVLTRLYGRVSDASTNSPIGNAIIQFLSSAKREVLSQPDGVYSANLPAIEAYHIKVEAPGFIGNFETLDLRTQVMKDLEMNFTLHPIEVGATVNLKSVLFEQSKPNLLTESYDELDMVADFMKQNPLVEIELAGHTDNRGKHDLNMKLSRERVGKVKEYLVSKGIAESRITGRGYGGTKPIADNDVDETRKLNRRVEFTIVKD